MEIVSGTDFCEKRRLKSLAERRTILRLMVDILRHLGELGKIVKNGKIPEYFDLTVNS